MLLFRLILTFSLVPLAELFLLIEVGRRIGTLNTILLVIGTGVLGATLAKTQGFQIINRVGGELRRGEIPAESLLEGLLVLVAGLLLVTPGLVTDTVGFVLLIPALRRRVMEWLKLLLFRWLQHGTLVIIRRRR